MTRIGARMNRLPKYEKDFFKKRHTQKALYEKNGKSLYNQALFYTYEKEIYEILYKLEIFVNMDFKYHAKQGINNNNESLFVRMSFQEVCGIVYEEALNNKELYPLCANITLNRFKKGFDAYTTFLSNTALVLLQDKNQTDIKIEKSFNVSESFDSFYKSFECVEVENEHE